MRLSFEVQGFRQAATRIEGSYYRCYLAAVKEMQVQMLELNEYAVRNTMHGQVVRHLSGNLASNVKFTVTEAGEAVIGRVGIPMTNTAPYARILHDGGTTRAHLIPKDGSTRGIILAFMWKGALTFRRFVNHPGSRFPSRPYLTIALQARKAAIVAGLTRAMKEALSK